jgi:hypothetical protein
VNIRENYSIEWNTTKYTSLIITRRFMVRGSEQVNLKIRESSQKKWGIFPSVQKDSHKTIKLCSRASAMIMNKETRISMAQR